MQPSAVNEMDAATDPLGLVWRTLRNGRLVVHPAPWDTTNTDRYINPLLAVYPDGIVFSWNPDFTELEYIVDDDNEPPGLQRTSLGVINTINITTPTSPPPYAIDNPTSQSKYGMRGFTANWIIDNDPVADDILAARADASQQATPIRTTIDHDGFFPAMAMIDHLDPVSFVHTTHDDGNVITALGSVRTITEVRSLRHAAGLSWESTVQIDVASSAAGAALRGPIDLEITSRTDISAAAAWTNVSQPDVTPTETQYRVLEQALIWIPIPYAGVGPDTLALFALTPSTVYTLQVRHVRRVNGIITHASNVAEVQFTTITQTQPTPVPDDDDTDVDIPGGDDDDCVVELDLEENDGSGWVVVDSWDESDMTPNGDGTFRLTTPIPNSFFNEGSVYRFVWREICGTVVGPDVIGPTFDPPDDWADPCTTPPALSNPPFNAAELTVYVPKVCAPDIITEAVSGIAGIHGSGYGGLLALVGDPNYRAIEANATGGIVAYGSCPQITGIVGTKTVTAKVFVPAAEFLTFWECSAMRITCTPSGSGWKAGATVFTPSGTGTCLSSEMPLHSAGEAAVITAVYDDATGDLTLYVDGLHDGDTTFGGAQDTINALPTWFAGAVPGGWVTDCAMFEGVQTPAVPILSVVLWEHFYSTVTPEFVALAYTNGATVNNVPDEILTDDMNQAVSTKTGPTYVVGGANFGGAPSLTQTASQGRQTNIGANPAGPFSVLFVGRYTSASNGYITDSDSAGGRFALHTEASGGFKFTANGANKIDAGFKDQLPHAFVMYNDASTGSFLNIDGTTAVSGNVGGTDNWGGFRVGSLVTSDAGVPCEWVAYGVYDGDITADPGWPDVKQWVEDTFGIVMA